MKFGDVTLAGTTDPVIGIPSGPIKFVAALGGDNPGDQQIYIQNRGGGTLDWTVVSDMGFRFENLVACHLLKSKGLSTPVTIGR